MHFKILFLIFCTTTFAAEVYFSPSPDCENRISQAIRDSKEEIKVAVYSINNRKIFEALKEAKSRGVKIRILTDYTQATQKSSLVFDLIQAGLDTRVHSKHKIEHNKFAVYDGKLVSTGSFNWTGPAARSNSENCVFLDDTLIISQFSKRFDWLWEKNTAQGSLARLQKLKTRRLSNQNN